MTIFHIVLIALWATSHTVEGRQGEPLGTQAPTDLAIFQQIEQGSIASIREAGESRRAAFLPSLKRAEKSKWNYDVQWELDLALAKLGDPPALQRFLCLSRNARFDSDGLGLFAIGGWFGIRGLVYLLSDEWASESRRFATEKNRRNGDALSSHSEEQSAIDFLILLLPGAPEALRIYVAENATRHDKDDAFNQQRDRLVREWPVWVSAHADELRNLEPTGAGADFSKGACNTKTGKPRKH